MARALDPAIDKAVIAATLALLADRGFARTSMTAVAAAAGVGKPAIYRRFPDKASLVAAAIADRLRPMPGADLGDTRAELWAAVDQGFPDDGDGYVTLLGGLMAERTRHPELLEAFRSAVLLPRRATVRGLIARGQRRGDIRDDVSAGAALDLLAGPFLARVFAGVDTGARWRRDAFAAWWTLMSTKENR